MKTKNLIRITLLAVLAFTCGSAIAADIISLNFSENSNNQIFDGGQLIGPLQTDSANWNITDVRDSGTLAAGTKSNLIDDWGINIGVSVTWESSVVYWNHDGTADDEHKMSVGYIDDGGDGINIVFENIPYARYRVYGLIATDQNQGAAGATPPNSFPARNFQVNGQWVFGGDESTTARAYGTITNNYDAHGEYWTEIVPGEVVGNYWTFETSGSTLTIQGLTRNGEQRGTLTAVIIEQASPYVAVNPIPAPGGELVAIDTILSWEQAEAVSEMGITYDVYLGTEPNTIGYPTPVKVTTDDPADFFYDPEGLLNDTTYYWRVDAVEPNDPSPVVHTGIEWWFTTTPAKALIQTHPAGVTVPAGGEAVFSVTAINAESYQWYKDGLALSDSGTVSGATTATLTVSNVQLADEGFYHCEVDNALETPDASNTAQLLTARQVGWWKLDGDLTDSIGQLYPGAPAFDGATDDPNFVEGIDSQALALYGQPEDVVVMTDSAEFYNFYPRGYSVSAWIKTTQTSPWGAYVAKQAPSPNRGFILTHNNVGQAVHTLRQSFNDLGSNYNIDDDVWHLVLGTYDAATGQGSVYVNGVLRNQATNTNVPQPSPADLIFGAELPDGSVPYIGLLDDVRIWSYPLDAVDAAELYVNFKEDEKICVTYPEFDIAGPDGVGEEFRDCRVDIYDLMAFVETWLECGIVPLCIE